MLAFCIIRVHHSYNDKFGQGVIMLRKQQFVWSGVVLSGIGAASYVLKDRKRRVRLQRKMYETMQKVPFVKSESDAGLPVEKAGHPEPHDIDDNKMVAEGAQTAVQYYDKEKK